MEGQSVSAMIWCRSVSGLPVTRPAFDRGTFSPLGPDLDDARSAVGRRQGARDTWSTSGSVQRGYYLSYLCRFSWWLHLLNRPKVSRQTEPGSQTCG